MERIEIKNAEKLLSVSMSKLNDARFEQCMLERLYFNDVNMSGTKIIDANLTGLEIKNAQLGGAFLHDIGMPPEGHPLHDAFIQQRPIRFEDCYLANSSIVNCNLSGVTISDCNVQGMVINGIPVEELLKLYNNEK